MVNLMAEDDLFCKLEMDAFIFFRTIKNNKLPSLFEMLKFLVSCYMGFVLRNITTINLHNLLPQYMSKRLSRID